MTLLTLTRHGASEWHREDRYAGSSDIALNPDGHAQATALAAWALHAGLDAVVTSPLRRCRDTARPVAEACGLEPWSDARLRELDFGDAEGLTKAELRERLGAAFAAFEADPIAAHLPGGEDPRAAVLRLRAGVDELARQYPDGHVLVVGHSTSTRLLLCDLLGIPLERYRSVFPVLRNCALTRVRVRGTSAALLTFNEDPRQATGDRR